MVSGNFDGDSLQIYFRRIVNLEKDRRAEIANFNEDIKAIYGEAKEAGFKPKILRGLVADELAPQKDQEDRDLEAIYRDALGLGGTPLAQAADQQEAQREKDRAAAEALDAADRAAMKPKAKGKGAKKAKEQEARSGAAATGKEQVDPETGEVIPGSSPGTARGDQKAGRVAPDDLPDDPFEAAKVIALQASYGKIDARVADRARGRFELVRSKAAVGTVGEEMDDAHFALLEAGYHHVKGTTYAVPDRPPSMPADGEPEHATEGV